MSEQDFQAIKDFWNDRPSLPKVIAITSKRRVKLAVRMEEPEFNQNWKLIIDIMADSPFCCGYNDRGWKATFDWIITNDNNYIKVLEGKYTISLPKTQAQTIEDVQLAQWENQCGEWLRPADRKTIEAHGGFRQRLKELSFRAWAESVNPIVKEI